MDFFVRCGSGTQQSGIFCFCRQQFTAGCFSILTCAGQTSEWHIPQRC
jgi:hypothetical protein